MWGPVGGAGGGCATPGSGDQLAVLKEAGGGKVTRGDWPWGSMVTFTPVPTPDQPWRMEEGGRGVRQRCTGSRSDGATAGGRP